MMKTWRLISGILSMVLALVVLLQSCAVGVVEAFGEEGTDSASGLLVALLLVAGGVVSVVTRKGGKGGSIAVMAIYAVAAIIGISATYYGDLVIWGIWCAVCAVMALLSLFIRKKKNLNDTQ